MTLKATRQPRLVTITAAVGVAIMIMVFSSLISAGTALADQPRGSEPTLNGGWAPFNRCPVDEPAMLEADGLKKLAGCLAESSPSGSVKLGNLSVATGASNHQIAFVLNQETEENEVISPPGGALRDESVQLPGGLRELMCPSSDDSVRNVCRYPNGSGSDNPSNAVTFTLESAGTPSKFNLFAGLFKGIPIALIPVKVHLQNEMLGDDCHIGSDAEPIVLKVANLAQPVGTFELFDPNGTPDATGAMLRIGLLNTSQGASSFAVPAASDCGHRGLFDQAIDEKVGLPSPAGGKNSVVFENATSYLILLEENVVPNYGKVLSEDWHSAVIPPSHGNSGHEHHGGGHSWSDHEIQEYFQHRFGHGH